MPSHLTVGILSASAAIVRIHGPASSRDHLADALLDELDRISPDEPPAPTEDDPESAPEQTHQATPPAPNPPDD